MRLIDSHAHFDDNGFNGDRDAALERARAAGVAALIVPGITAVCWPRLRDVCARHGGLYPAYGLHPLYLATHREAHLDELARWIAREKPVAVGEIGLDYYVDGLDREGQKRYFLAQLTIAREARLPVVIHARRAVEEVYQLLRRFAGMTGVVHSFAGSEEQARRLTDLGYCLGFGGPVTYPRAHRLRVLLRHLPLEHVLLESDAPDQPGILHRGERNESAFLPDILHEIARLRDEDPARIAAVTYENTRRLFRLGDLP